MAKSTCSVDGCERLTLAKGLCKAHYERNRRTGSPGAVTIRPPVVPSRVPRLGCLIEGCEWPHKSFGYCNLHYQRLYRHGDPLALMFTVGPDHPQWKGDALSYIGAHHRVWRLRGLASNYECEHCGRKADHWAYDHSDPDALVSNDGMYPYSSDPTRYLPLCQSCHVRFDREWRRVHPKAKD